MSIAIAIDADPDTIKKIRSIHSILEQESDNPDVVDLKIWISSIENMLTNPTVFDID